MATLREQLALLRGYNKAVQERDPKLAEEVRDRMGEETVTESAIPPEEIDRQVEQETIVMRRERPVLAIKENVTQLVFIDKVDSEIWGERLKNAKSVLDTAIPAVGRIDLRGAPLGFVGTGWLVAENVIVTNRHVAEEFATRRGEGFTFKTGPTGAPMSSSVDFLEELDNPAKLVFNLVRPLHIEDSSGPDLAFFEIEMVSGDARLAKPIDLVTEIGEIEHVATIGYPAYDSRIPEPELMERIYGKTYNKKRLAPGGITRLDPVRIWHNCTTLGGNSGSLVFDLDKGKAVGLHFSGSFLVTNYAVRADVVKKRLADVRAGRAMRRTEAPTRPQAPLAAQATRPAIATTQRGSGGTATLSIPLTVNVSISLDGARSALRDRGLPVAASSVEAADNIAETESVAGDYRDREGYVANFLGKKFKVDLPEVTRDAGDVLDFEIDGETQTELRYEHYSVVMSRSRRMCFFSACNIDGQQSRKSARVAWKWDPRIPKSQQIMKECYGSPPKFSRGHMTRREDPGWGTPTVAKRGNEEFDARHQHDAADAGLQRADLARAGGLCAAARARGRHEDLGVHRAIFPRQGPGDVWRAHPARVLEDHRVHP